MDKKSLTALARQQLKLAGGTSSGRSSQTVYGGHRRSLRQTVVALTAGQKMAEHESPGEGTLFILSGKLTLVSGEDSWKGSSGDFLVLPSDRHSVEALEDVAFLLTVAM
ncbi:MULTISPECIES: cupin domain-containing protein [Rhodococcus]|jgi:quercetin dioxygenase-like cupin family protein|uniref:Cupin domain-containing protein n=1 Tax=Rhodococcus oxybenzonivorans TaxID=1990687 RepID=A0AAE4V4N6_9NOCA|nr:MULTISPECIES: cupin domain-containing protein [Rhodococcus]MDV7240678.1 cupin domain-containing protein [Rhodococcus oxybenzonivorans]MDV7267719.1 cupin domain-containing protein [Rhodococcus oxybenzonivorans]MDV7272951.1 cupin domain-containing protein [Rhodococcus oxybenzonivorans]MDV7333310.1 cupin domain-containing protein [Rhodococcus oxybenzonivorans]MDV7342477.1 cupin domain-containing protein [Rhodococcus oxybenzonivorans]